jgi:hypothetical protein
MKKNRVIQPILFNLAAAGLLLIVFFSILEFGLRWREVDTKLIDKAWVQNHIFYNKVGFRDNDYSIEKSDGVFRILIVGDSQTFGHGIDRLEDTYPKKLESRLNSSASKTKFEVLSFARPGWNADSHIQYLYKKGLAYQPDLILLAFYHNDILPPAYFDCDSTDQDIVDSDHFLNPVLNSSSVYRFLKFRINRGLEAAGEKPNYIQCRKEIYDSRAWDMQKVYLDTLIGTAQVNRTHFMMTVIPVLFRLDDDYPMQFAHDKLAGFCTERNLECVDLFDKAIRGVDAKEYVVSEGDRHLNEKGSELVANVLFETLKPLTEIERVERFHRAFDLKDLLNEEGVLKGIGERLDNLNSPDGMISVSSQDFQLMAFKDVERYLFLKTNINPESGKRKSLSQTALDKWGRYLSSEKVDYDPSNGKPIRKDIWNDTRDGKELSILLANHQGQLRVADEEFYPLKYVSTFYESLDKFQWHLEIRENEFFADPLTLESSIFYPKRSKLKRPEGKEIFSSLRFYRDFYFYAKSGKAYADSLAKEIIDRSPFPEAVRAAKQYLEDPFEVIANAG